MNQSGDHPVTRATYVRGAAMLAAANAWQMAVHAPSHWIAKTIGGKEAVLPADIDAQLASDAGCALICTIMEDPSLAEAVERIGEDGALSAVFRINLARASRIKGAPAEALDCETVVVKTGPSAFLSRLACLIGRHGKSERELPAYFSRRAKDASDPFASFFANFAAHVHCGWYSMWTGSYMIVIEDLAKARWVDFEEGPTFADACTAIDTLATMHAAFWGIGNEELAWIRTPAEMDIIADLAAEAWPTFEARFRGTAHWRDEVGTVGSRAMRQKTFRALSARMSVRRTLVHGDYRTSNIAFDVGVVKRHHEGAHAAENERRPCVVFDWQNAYKGCGALDLEHFIVESLPCDMRRQHGEALLKRYHATLVANGVCNYSYEECKMDFRYAVAYNLHRVVLGLKFNNYTPSGWRQFLANVERTGDALAEYACADIVA